MNKLSKIQENINLLKLKMANNAKGTISIMNIDYMTLYDRI